MNRWFFRTGLLAVAALGAFALMTGVAPRAAAEEDSAGRKVFDAQKCGMCHDVSSAGIKATTKSDSMKGGDLTGITSRHDADWIGKYLRQEIEKDGNKHKKLFKGTDDELKALITWLEAQTG